MGWLGLKGKAVIVTGGASGIGKAVCEGLAECGASVAIGDVSQEAGEQLCAELKEKFGGEHLFAFTNVTDKESVDGLIGATVDASGKVDVLVNNAGINIPRLLVDPAGEEEFMEDVWDKVVSTNQEGLFLCTQTAARVMPPWGSDRARHKEARRLASQNTLKVKGLRFQKRRFR